MKHNILIVDDDPGVIKSYQFTLGKEYDYSIAVNRKEAFDLLVDFKLDMDKPITDANNPLSLAILDQKLGDYDPAVYRGDWEDEEGLKLISFIRTQISPLTRIVVCTAYYATAKNRGFNAARLGSDGYWSKEEMQGEALRAQVAKEVKRFDQAVLKQNRKIREITAG